ncbi:MAG: polysaccharide pyruvyl transferase family protein [Chloroflexota bacterium]
MARHSPGRSRIVILGWYGSNNTGDEALLQVIVEALRERGLDDIVVLSTKPDKTSARLSVASTTRSLFSIKTFRALHGANALILGGGGLMQDGTSVYNLPIYAAYVALARLLGLKVIGWGLGAEPLWTLLGRWLVRFIIHSSDHFSLRDHLSKQLLVKAGVSPGRIEVTADPAMLLNPEPVETGLPDDGRPVVIFCIRHLPAIQPGFRLHYLMPVSLRHRLGAEWKLEPGRVEGLVESLARGIKVAVQELGARVVLLPLWPGRDDEMLDIVEQAALELGVAGDQISRAEVEHTPGRFSGYVGKADLLVSMRLHALIFASVQGVPMIALSYARKVRGLMRELGFERWVVEVETRTPPPKELEMKMRQLWQMRDQESARLKRAGQTKRAIARADADKIAHLLTAQTKSKKC